MSKRKGYGQYCPVAKAAEIVAERWTPLILRDLLAGTTRFNDLRRGVPLMSPSLLSRRLKELEFAGVVERRGGGDGKSAEYHLTDAGEELRPVIEQLGWWGRRWVQSDIGPEDADPGLLMWDVQHNMDREALPEGRTVVEFQFRNVPRGKQFWWLLAHEGDVDICPQHPGFDVDLTVEADVRTLVGVWMGLDSIRNALQSGEVTLTGSRDMVRCFPKWFAGSVFAYPPKE